VRRRILLAIIGVTTLATIVLTIPLGLIIANRENDDASTELDRVAERTAAELPARLDVGDEIELPRVERGISIAVYDATNLRIAGSGPRIADRLTASPTVLTKTGTVGDEQIVTRPVTFNERRIGVIRVAEATRETARRIGRDILLLLSIDAAAILIAAIVGSALAKRLVKPLMVIRDEAVHLGNGDFSIHPAPSGVSELDETADALIETARRLDATMRREREFTANSSHQLRTPLAALRLTLESEIMTPRQDHTTVLHESIEEVYRLEATIETMLAFARDRPLNRSALDVGATIASLQLRWSDQFEVLKRGFHVVAEADMSAHISEDVLAQILEVLIGNAMTHGRGTVSIVFLTQDLNLAVMVRDEGTVSRDPADLFVRRHPAASDNGVGLALARTLAEAEGGRLTLTETSPTTFLLLLPDLPSTAETPD